MKPGKKPGKKAADFKRSPCPIANTLDLVGDKWTLLIVRDLLFFGKRQYREFSASPERIPSNILADRLKRLERAGLVAKTPYQQRPVRYAYALTPTGADLKPVLLALIEWGNRHIAGTYRPPAERLRKERRR
ncbi:MAG: helix-turn-helix transcriptional regulator [Gammaproteobacteria bacterium]|nr:helix-turn-helix transcriptional regulator [Gammaproteobacteria bacterium]